MFRPAEVLLDGEGGDSIEIIFVQLPRDPWQASIRLLSQCLNFFCYLGNRQRVKKFDYLKVSPTENNKPLAGEGWSSGQMGHWNGTIAQASPASQAPLLLPLLSPSHHRPSLPLPPWLLSPTARLWSSPPIWSEFWASPPYDVQWLDSYWSFFKKFKRRGVEGQRGSGLRCPALSKSGRRDCVLAGPPRR